MLPSPSKNPAIQIRSSVVSALIPSILMLPVRRTSILDSGTCFLLSWMTVPIYHTPTIEGKDFMTHPLIRDDSMGPIRPPHAPLPLPNHPAPHRIHVPRRN